jgi:hypothetical protein
MLIFKRVASVLFLLICLHVSNAADAKEYSFNLTLIRGGGGFLIYYHGYDQFLKLSTSNFSPMVSFKIPHGLKAYVGGSFEFGPFFELTGDIGLGKEIPLNNIISIEPLGLVRLGAYSTLSEAAFLPGAEVLMRFNVSPINHLTFFTEGGVNAWFVQKGIFELPLNLGITFSW